LPKEHGSLRHEVQTLPLWAPIVLGFRGHKMAKWSGLACLTVWLLLMLMIWSFLAGWTHLLSGHFSPVEIVLTIVVGTACVCGIAMSIRWRTAMGRPAAFGAVVLFVGLQLLAVRLSFLPYIANR
jgi:hypothetical protein